MAKIVQTSIGNCTPRTAVGNGSGAFVETPAFVGNPSLGTASLLGTLYAGGHTYTLYHGRLYGSNTVWVYKDGVEESSTYINVYSTYSGFWVDNVNGTGYVFWASVPDPEAVSGYTFPLVAGEYPGQSYNARQLFTAPIGDITTTPWDEKPETDPDDPYNIEPKGGEYADREPFDATDEIDINDLPFPELFSNMDYGGVVRLYALNETQMQNIASNLFTGNFWTDLKNKFSGVSDPLSMILNCIQLPFTPSASDNATFTIGGVQMTGVQASYSTSRYKKESFGTVHIGEVWGSEKDYSEVTISLYLPYVGVKEVDPDIVVNTDCTLICYIDTWTGDLLYLLHVSNTNSSGTYYRSNSVPYRWAGNCAKKVPLGRVDNTGAVMKIAGAAVALGVGLGTMGAGMAVAAPGAAAAVGGNAAVAAGSAASMVKTGAVGAGAGAAGLLGGFKPTVQTSSGIEGASGAMDIQNAYFIIKRGVPAYPNNWREQIGAPRFQTLPISGLTGYTSFSDIKLENMGLAVAEEVAELENLVKTEGIIL